MFDRGTFGLGELPMAMSQPMSGSLDRIKQTKWGYEIGIGFLVLGVSKIFASLWDAIWAVQGHIPWIFVPLDMAYGLLAFIAAVKFMDCSLWGNKVLVIVSWIGIVSSLWGGFELLVDVNWLGLYSTVIFIPFSLVFAPAMYLGSGAVNKAVAIMSVVLYAGLLYGIIRHLRSQSVRRIMV
jgi:hypothetical protein